MVSDKDVAQLVELVRDEVSHVARACKREKLLDLLSKRGIEVTRYFVVSLNSRVLTPGARKPHDDTVRALLKLWKTSENILGLELDPREVAVLGAFDDIVIAAGIKAGLFQPASGPDERTRALSGLLWPKTDALRREALTTWTPFRKLTIPIPQLAQAVLFDTDSITASMEMDNWRDVLIHGLSTDGIARLEAPAEKHRELKKAIFEFEFLASPVHVGHLQLYPTVERISKETIKQEGRKLTAHFVLREQV